MSRTSSDDDDGVVVDDDDGDGDGGDDEHICIFWWAINKVKSRSIDPGVLCEHVFSNNSWCCIFF